MTRNPFETDLAKTPANFVALSPISFIQRTARVYPERTSVIHGAKRFTWGETYARARRLASALVHRGVKPGDTVAVMASNTPEMVECAFAVPMMGAVLNTLNVRLDCDAVAFCLNHGEASVLITDTEFSATVAAALPHVERDLLIIDIDDSEAHERTDAWTRIGATDYEAFLETGDPAHAWTGPSDEWNAISLNYTSGTTGNPKGVVYHHRGAYLNALSNALSWQMPLHPVYLWTLPMFHCNGWCFPWTLAAMAGTSVCLRRVTAASIYTAIAENEVSHFSGAPIVLSFIINAAEEERRDFAHAVNVMVAAAPPPAATLERMAELGFSVTHVYGLTETYGPATLCAWKDDWDDLAPDDKAFYKSRQGVPYHVLEDLTVKNPDTMETVAADGETMGEVMFRGNVVMKGYLKNPDATQAAFAGGWFHSGDLGVLHPDGYIQVKDRSKDVIISGGENISSIEVEDALYRHPDIIAAAVVAKPDDTWGETPCAFIELRDGADLSPAAVIDYCRGALAHFKCPRHVVFGDLPRTSTGKIQKFKLRDQAKDL